MFNCSNTLLFFLCTFLGILAFPTTESVLFVNTSDVTTDAPPDIQFTFTSAPLTTQAIDAFEIKPEVRLELYYRACYTF